MAVRSRRFFGPVLKVAPLRTTLYTVPAGRTAVVRSLQATYGGSTAGELTIFINGVAWIIHPRSSRGFENLIDEAVWDPTDIIEAEVTGLGGWLLTAGGSLLLGAPS